MSSQRISICSSEAVDTKVFLNNEAPLYSFLFSAYVEKLFVSPIIQGRDRFLLNDIYLSKDGVSSLLLKRSVFNTSFYPGTSGS